MAGHGEKLSRKREMAIAALLSQPTISAAAKKAGVGERTLYRWLQLADVKKAYLEARRRLVSQATAQIQAGMTAAVQTLRSVMENEETPASARVACARTIIETGLKALEIEDLDMRIQVLESRLANKGTAA